VSFTHAGLYGPDQFIDSTGKPLPNLAVTVYLTGTQTLTTLYTDRTQVTQAVNPTSTDINGNLSFYAAPGRYDIVANGLTFAVEVQPDPGDQASALISDPIGDTTGVALDTSPTNAIKGSGTITELEFPANTVAEASGISGDSYPRFLRAADPATGISVGDGTFEPHASGPNLAYASVNGGKVFRFQKGDGTGGIALGGNVVSFGSGAPTIGGAVGDRYYQSDGDAVWRCITAGVAVWVLADSVAPTSASSPVTGSAYTFALTDLGKYVEFSSASAQTATIPPNSSVAFPVGAVIPLANLNTGKVTIAAGAGVTLVAYSSEFSLLGQYAEAWLRQRAANTWHLTGAISS
jgi:hypothetical protein